MTAGDITALRIEGLTATGSGLARVRDRCIFVDFTAPGDVVRLSITEDHKSWSRGEALEILEPSPERINPGCPLYGNCGGCNFQHIDYKAQIKNKASILKESFIRNGVPEPPDIRVYESSPWEYRNRVQFHCVPDNRRYAGFMGKKGGVVIPLNDCPIADPGIRDALKNRGGNRLIPPPEKDRFTVYSRGDVFLSEGGERRGRITLGKTGCQKSLLIDAGVFFQSNSVMLEFLLEDLIVLSQQAEPGLPFGDIFAGVGTFAAFLAERFSGAELVEENKAALTLARENVKAENSRFYAIKTDEWLKRTNPAKKSWGFMVVDPPRDGLAKNFRQYLPASTVSLLAYVSCNPVTLARDSRDLIAGGFVLKELNMYDFYPQTSHIESLAVFSR